MSYELHNTDCRTFLAGEPSRKYDLLLADPPYYTTNLGFDKAAPIDYEREFWPEAWRVLKPNGVVVLFAAGLFTVDLILSQRAAYRYRLVWEKNNATGFLNANRQPMCSHEDIVVFGFNGAASTYNPQRTKAIQKATSRRKADQPGHYNGVRLAGGYEDDGTRHPTTVLAFAGVNRTDSQHPSQKPTDLLRWLIRTYSNAGDTVLDCFAGSGSTIEACLLEGRHGVGVELDAEYYSRATRRLQTIEARPQLDFAHPAGAPTTQEGSRRH